MSQKTKDDHLRNSSQIIKGEILSQRNTSMKEREHKNSGYDSLIDLSDRPKLIVEDAIDSQASASQQ